jgi:hypothetical protein
MIGKWIPIDELRNSRCDSGTELITNEFQKQLQERGIRLETSPAYEQMYNGKAEAFVKLLKRMSRCMLINARLPAKFMRYAVEYAAYLRNLSSTRVSDTPAFELMYKRKVTLKYVHPFGCLVEYRIPPSLRTGMKLAGSPGLFIGLQGSGIYRVFCQQYVTERKALHKKHYDCLPAGGRQHHAEACTT